MLNVKPLFECMQKAEAKEANGGSRTDVGVNKAMRSIVGKKESVCFIIIHRTECAEFQF